jgi:tetratricopeptide (TPR) repeat protein
MSNRLLPFALLLALVPFVITGMAHAKKEPVEEGQRAEDPRVTGSVSFLQAHPDLRYRQAGLAAYKQGEFEEAHGYFRRAARFADKPSQGMLAEMLWKGEGVAQDRPQAYAWMDLAAERAYKTMLMQRERFWEAMTPDEQARAVEVGKDLYAEYGDAVAKPRLERKMRFARRASAGSRTGFVGNMQITVTTLHGEVTIDGSHYYHPDYWEPALYWAWQEKGWKEPPKGRVDVGPLSGGGAATGDDGAN